MVCCCSFVPLGDFSVHVSINFNEISGYPFKDGELWFGYTEVKLIYSYILKGKTIGSHEHTYLGTILNDKDVEENEAHFYYYKKNFTKGLKSGYIFNMHLNGKKMQPFSMNSPGCSSSSSSKCAVISFRFSAEKLFVGGDDVYYVGFDVHPNFEEEAEKAYKFLSDYLKHRKY